MATERITPTTGGEESSGGLGALASLDRRRRDRAFARMYAKHHQELFRYCLSILRNREDAEDALQATMAAALRSLPGEKREIALRPWLFRVAHNESISLLRTRRPTSELDEGSAPAGPTAEVALEERDRLRQLVVDLRSLPERQNAALVMRELSGLSYEEIGAALSTSEGAARQAVYEGRVALRTREEGREMECEIVRRAISDRDGRRLRGRALKAHLETCDGCHAFAASIDRRRTDLAALCPPIPALAAAGVFSGVLGGGSSGGAAAGASAASATGVAAVGGGVAGSLAIKGAALVAAVGIAAGAADIGGAIDLAHPFGGDGASNGSSGVPAPAVPNAQPDPTGEAGITAPVGVPAAPGRGNNAGPGQSGAHPGGVPDPPGHGGPNPGKAETGPGQPGTTSPGKSEDAPGHSGDSPGKSEDAPGHSGSTPGKSEDAPGHSDASPGKSETAPGQTGSSPGKSEAAPGHTGTAPGQSGSAPGQSGSSPGKSESAPGQAVEPPTIPPVPAPGASNGNGVPPVNPGASNGNSPK